MPPGGEPPYNTPYGHYPPPPAYSAAPLPVPLRRNGMAVAALVLGVLAVVTAVTVVFGVVFGVLAAILGFVAAGRAKRGLTDRHGMAIAGAILGLLGVLLSVVMTFWVIWLWNEAGISDYIDCVSDAPNRAAEQICSDQLDDRLNDVMR